MGVRTAATVLLAMLAFTACSGDRGEITSTGAPQGSVADAATPEAVAPGIDVGDVATGWRRIPEIDGATRLAGVPGLGLVAVEADAGAWQLDPDNPSRFRSWVTSDGVVWSGGDTWYDGQISSVVGASAHFVAAGIDEGGNTGALWSSNDGVTWQRMTDTAIPADLRPCEPDDPFVSCGISIDTTDGSLLITGFDPEAPLPRDRDILTAKDRPGCAWWLSADVGATWRRVEAPEGCGSLHPSSHGWVAVDRNGALTATENGTDWMPLGALPEAPSIWSGSGDGIVATRSDDWLATSIDGGRTWDVANLPLPAETEGAAVSLNNFVVHAVGADGTPYLFQRAHEASGWTDWAVAEVEDGPGPGSVLTAHGGALFAVAPDGVWQWGEYEIVAPGDE